MIGGLVPSAGVGTAFSRYAIDHIAEKLGNGNLFNIRTLTEDYGFSVMLHRHKLKAIFVHRCIPRIQRKRRWGFFGPMVPKKERERIATRALFPTCYSNAVRQKSRWILGISFQEWQETGWMGNAATRYTLLRDRKGPVGNFLCLAGYFYVAYFAYYHFERWLSLWNPLLPTLHETSLMLLLFYLNVFFMAERILQRMVAVNRIYGPVAAVLSVPRIIYGNIINAHAFFIALSTFVKSARSGHRPEWAKTTNAFPTFKQLTPYRRMLGDLLLESSAITSEQLSIALTKQASQHRKLGAILVEEGFITEHDLLPFLSRLFGMSVVNFKEIPLLFTADIERLALEKREWIAKKGLTLIQMHANLITLAATDQVDEALRVEAETILGGFQVNFALTTQNQLKTFIDRQAILNQPAAY
jgi:adsorption protein B